MDDEIVAHLPRANPPGLWVWYGFDGAWAAGPWWSLDEMRVCRDFIERCRSRIYADPIEDEDG